MSPLGAAASTPARDRRVFRQATGRAWQVGLSAGRDGD